MSFLPAQQLFQSLYTMPAIDADGSIAYVASYGLAILALLRVAFFLYAYRLEMRKAQRLGIPYVLSPISPMSPAWLIGHKLLEPLISILPRYWVDMWYSQALIPNHWIYGHKPFVDIKTDTFACVTPSELIIHTCDPDVVSQVLSKGNRDVLIKPPELVGIVNALGPSVVGTNGPEARVYRKIMGACMSDDTNRLVWTTTLQATDDMILKWRRQPLISDCPADVSYLTLAVMCLACYGRELDSSPPLSSGGHGMTFETAIATVMDRVQNYMLTPRFVTDYSPLALHRQTRRAFAEWRQYMEVMMADERARQTDSPSDRTNRSVLGALVAHGPGGQAHGKTNKELLLSQDAVWGNMFIFLVAGHETSANTVTYAMYLLACHPHIQRELQAAIDEIIGDVELKTCNFDAIFPKLWKSLLGAVIKETLRLWTVIPFIPKKAAAPTTLVVQGQPISVPKGAFVYLNVAASHRNPKHWPHEHMPNQPDDEEHDDDSPQRDHPVTSFNPHRWLGETCGETGTEATTAFEPTPGSFLGFSEGPRKCMGRRLAEVEMVAVLTTVLSKHTLTLDHDESVPSMSWTQRKRQAMRTMTDVHFMMSLKPKEAVPLRLVERICR